MRTDTAPSGRAGSTPKAGQAPVLDVAVVGSGISGLSAAWLLSHKHKVTLYEADPRPGGHSNTVDVPCAGASPALAARPPRDVAVDTGFIVYNESAYPNLTAMFSHLGVETRPSEMSFAVSLDGGALEYSGTDLRGIFAQRGNMVSARFWSMLRDLVRFYRQAPADARRADASLSLSQYLDSKGYGSAFRDDHLFPMAAAIWSTPAASVGDYPMQAFVRFCENHHLLKLTNRPAWRTVSGGSRSYVERLVRVIEQHGGRVLLDSPVTEVLRDAGGVTLLTRCGAPPRHHDHVVMATHADQTLRMLGSEQSPEPLHADERRLLGAFRSSRNHAVLHSDPELMPKRRGVWSSWNYFSDRRENPAGTNAVENADFGGGPCVTYWMNRLQGIADDTPLFVTLNPTRPPRPEHLIRTEIYEHPIFDAEAMAAQQHLWTLQGQRRTWYCGAWFGSGFHEDGLQAGLAVAEALGGVRRPWTVAGESSRIVLCNVREAEPAMSSSIS